VDKNFDMKKNLGLGFTLKEIPKAPAMAPMMTTTGPFYRLTQ
jgi:hypothetical protein